MIDGDKLMRGDFVMFYDKHKIGKVAKVDQVLRHSCLLLYNNYEDEIIVNYEKIHPIEITRKLLEDIGFTTQYIESIDTTVYRYEGFPFVIEVVFAINGDGKPNTKLFSVCSMYKEDGNSDPLHTIVDIKYVHQLQNLMNIFEINFDI